MKIHPVEAELFHADGRTDMTNLTVASGSFAKPPKNSGLHDIQGHLNPSSKE